MLVKVLFRSLDLLQVPRIFQLAWHLLTGVSRLTDDEIDAAGQVLGPDAVRYPSVRVAEGRVLRLIFRLNGDRAITLFHTINLPASGHHSRGNLSLFVHEMVHVRQYEEIGSRYIWEAIRAQMGEGYSFGGWEKLAEERQNGRLFSGYNREQQGQIAQDYYRQVLAPALPADHEVRLAFQPFIDDLKAGIL